MFESMKQISYISLLAIVSILAALTYILVTDVIEIVQPTFDKTYALVNFEGFPAYFGISMFMFEGNALALEIYQQMENGPVNFRSALGIGLQVTIIVIIVVSSFSYAAYAQYTRSIILLNLKPSPITYLVQIFYSIGIIFSFCLQIAPTFKIMKILPWYDKIPDSGAYPGLKGTLTRAATAIFCCLLAYYVKNIS